MKESLRLLLVEDSVEDAELLLWEIRNAGYEVVHSRVETLEAMRQQLRGDPWDIIISDYTMPKFSGLSALRLAQLHDPDLPFILLSGNIGADLAVEAMRAGAHDYVMKNNPSRLIPAIERELRESGVRRAARRAQRQIEESDGRLRALISNIPGVVFQLQRTRYSNHSFCYVSESCQPLLELSARQLQDDSALFFELLLDGGDTVLRSRIDESARTLRPFSWEGRIRTASSGHVKWIEIRLSPRPLSDHRILWEGIMENISRRKAAESEIVQSRQALSELSSHLQHAKEVERTRIARQVQDDIGGNLTAVKIDLLWLIEHIGKRRTDLLKKAHSVAALLDRTMETASRIAHGLRPPLLDLGLPAAVEWEAHEFQKRTEIPCTVTCTGEDIALAPELATALFSVFHETLTNIAKHAAATKVEVELGIDSSLVTLKVSDNGRGVVHADLLKRGSFGLRGMRERARHLGGEISFAGKPGQGTTVTARLPLEPASQSRLSAEIDSP